MTVSQSAGRQGCEVRTMWQSPCCHPLAGPWGCQWPQCDRGSRQSRTLRGSSASAEWMTAANRKRVTTSDWKFETHTQLGFRGEKSVFLGIWTWNNFCDFSWICQATYLPLSVFPGPVDQINWEDFHTQPPLNAVHHDVKAFTVPDDEAGMIQFVRHLFEVQVGILR